MGHTPTPYSLAVSRLNPTQRQAVETLDGPLMLLAGPGTGKTQVITVRIASILAETDTPPESIIALTFTESGAATMRERLVALVGPVGYRVTISTFHAFAGDVIARHREYFPLSSQAQPLTEIERLMLFRHIIQTGPYTALRPIGAPDLYLHDIARAISDLKREHISVEAWQAQVATEVANLEISGPELKKAALAQAQKQVAKWQELATMFAAYQDLLRQRHRFDFDDMISFVNQAFEQHQDLLLEYQEKFLYILVDEFQDTNAAQNQILKHLTSYWGPQANICVVGDPDQAIFRFQGASIENMMAFKQDFPAAEIIVLETGYRCPPNVYQAIKGLIKQNQLRAGVIHPAADQPLISFKNQSSLIQLAKLPTTEAEAAYVANQVKNLLSEGVPAQEIAILYRTNREVEQLVPALHRLGVVTAVEGGQSVLAEPALLDLVEWWELLQALPQGVSDRRLFRQLLKAWWGLPAGLVIQVSQAARQAKVSLWTIISQPFSAHEEPLRAAGVTQLEHYQLAQVSESWLNWLQLEAQVPILSWIGQVISESGWLAWVKGQDRWPLVVASLAALQREMTTWLSSDPHLHLAEILHRLQLYEQYHVPLKLESSAAFGQAVTLTTAHRSKGQEWKHVFITRCLDGKWGNTRNQSKLSLPEGLIRQTKISSKDRNEDERRLLYVALSRTKEKLYLSYPERADRSGQQRDVLPSEFLLEIGPWLTQTPPELIQTWWKEQQAESTGWLTQPDSGVTWSEYHHLFDKAISQFVMSASALNAYLRSPEDFVMQYLLKMAEPPSPALAFGSAVHTSLEQFFRCWLDEARTPSLSELLTWFETQLKKEPLTEDDLARRLEQGRALLPQFFETQLAGGLPSVWQVEKRFGMAGRRVMCGDVPLTGKIDRLDWVDQSVNQVRVIDYKTGRPKTMGEINGATANAGLSEREAALPAEIRGPYKRQLLFYKLLTHLDSEFKAEVTDGVFEFVEPDKTSGKIITRVVPLPESEVAALSEVIQTVMRELRSGEFLKYLAKA